MKFTRGQIAAANLLFERINKAAQYEATAEEIRLAKIGQKIQRIKKEKRRSRK
jgi:hypothetical protein